VIIVGLTSVTSILSVVGLRNALPGPRAAPALGADQRRRRERLRGRCHPRSAVGGKSGRVPRAPTAVIVIARAVRDRGGRLIGLREPVAETASTGRLLTDALDGLRYAWSNPTIRGLGVALSSLNLGWGAMTIVVPIIILRELGYGDAVVGFVWAAVGVSGIVSASWFGRLDTRGREWPMLVIPMALVAPVIALALPAAGVLGPIAPERGSPSSFAMMLGYGVLNGSVDIALFTVRQRRTDPAWMGRAFAVSMAFNYLGFPVGAVIAGILVTVSIPAAIGVGLAASGGGRTGSGLPHPGSRDRGSARRGLTTAITTTRHPRPPRRGDQPGRPPWRARRSPGRTVPRAMARAAAGRRRDAVPAERAVARHRCPIPWPGRRGPAKRRHDGPWADALHRVVARHSVGVRRRPPGWRRDAGTGGTRRSTVRSRRTGVAGAPPWSRSPAPRGCGVAWCSLSGHRPGRPGPPSPPRRIGSGRIRGSGSKPGIVSRGMPRPRNALDIVEQLELVDADERDGIAIDAGAPVRPMRWT
jgi:hypothetical protein